MTTPTTPTTTTTPTPSSTPTGGAPAAGSTATAPKKTKKAPTPPEVGIFAVTKDPKTGLRTLTELPKPEGINEKNIRIKGAYKPAVRASLQDGKRAAEYNKKDIAVVAIHESFKFDAKIEKIETMKVQINEG